MDDSLVEDTANWSLTRDGAAVNIAQVTYDQGGNDQAWLMFDQPLLDGNYVLTVRDTLEDSDGNILDGDRDGAAGGDFVLAFSVRAAVLQGGELRVNTTTDNDQINPDVAMNADGSYVVVWQHATDYSSTGWDIRAQRYNAAGSPVGAEFTVNTITTGPQVNPAVAMDGDGNFIVVWDGYYSASSIGEQEILARRFAADGTPIDATEWVVNPASSLAQVQPDVAMDADGDFAIAWQSDYASYMNWHWDIAAAIFRSDGSFVTGGNVNGINGGNRSEDQIQPAIAMDADGDMVIVYADTDASYGPFGGTTIMGVRISNDGLVIPTPTLFGSVDEPFPVAFGGIFQFAMQPAVAMDADGDFVVAWTQVGYAFGSYYYGPNFTGHIRLKRFDAAGFPRGTIFAGDPVSGTDSDFNPSVAIDRDGDYVVTWTHADGFVYPAYSYSYSSFQLGGTATNVMVRRFDNAGMAQSDAERVNTFEPANQMRSAVGVDSDGDFVVVWQSGPSYFSSVSQDGEGNGIYQRRFDENEAPTSSGISDQTADENDLPIVLNLGSSFADAEDADSALTFTVENNTNSAIVATFVQGSSLALVILPDQFGTADITVRATDTRGRFVEDTFTLTVNEVIDPPAPKSGGDDDDGCAANTSAAAPWGLLAVLMMVLGSLRGLVRRKS